MCYLNELEYELVEVVLFYYPLNLFIYRLYLNYGILSLWNGNFHPEKKFFFSPKPQTEISVWKNFFFFSLFKRWEIKIFFLKNLSIPGFRIVTLKSGTKKKFFMNAILILLYTY